MTSMLARAARLGLVVLLAACEQRALGGGTLPQGALMHRPPGLTTSATTPIQHVVVIVQENRSFDNLFEGYRGADYATQGTDSKGNVVPLVMTSLAVNYDIDHWYKNFRQDWDGGKMDGFDRAGAGHKPYSYVDRKEVAPYWSMAKQYVLADHTFETMGSGSFTAHLDLIAGTTAIDATQSIVDAPPALPWGCDSAAGSTTSLLDKNGAYERNAGPFPCLSIPTIRDLLDDRGLSWKYYDPAFAPFQGVGTLWNAFDAIDVVRHGMEWGTNVVTPETKIFDDVDGGNLAAVSWVIPDLQNSDHPSNLSKTGPSWVASIVNAIGQSKYWKNTAIVVVWDDWGGWYDHVPPQQLDYTGLGFRVPMLIVSPYARENKVSHTQYEFGSILRFVEDNWNLGRLGTTDARANSIANAFDFNDPPRKFVPIAATYTRAFFLRQKPSNKPVDTQ